MNVNPTFKEIIDYFSISNKLYVGWYEDGKPYLLETTERWLYSGFKYRIVMKKTITFDNQCCVMPNFKDVV